jgi:hypothetical protein
MVNHEAHAAKVLWLHRENANATRGETCRNFLNKADPASAWLGRTLYAFARGILERAIGLVGISSSEFIVYFSDNRYFED